jgi:hypothetical protein
MRYVLGIVVLLGLAHVGALSSPAPNSDRRVRCPSESTIVAGGRPFESRGRREADIDGDGIPDWVSVVADYAAPWRCRFFLVAVTDRASAVLALDQAVLPASAASRARHGWLVDRRVFAIGNAALRLDHVDRVRVADLKSLPEFRSERSFASCSGP